MATYMTIKKVGANCIYIEFNALAQLPQVNLKDWSIPKELFKGIQHDNNDVLHLQVNNQQYPVSCLAEMKPDTLIIESIDVNDGNGAQTPTDCENMHQILNKLWG